MDRVAAAQVLQSTALLLSSHGPQVRWLSAWLGHRIG
jgi:hypothetical protein